MEGWNLLHSGHYCFLQHHGAQMTAQSPRCCPQYHQDLQMVEFAPVERVHVPVAAPLQVQLAQMGTWMFQGTVLCLIAQIVQKVLLAIAPVRTTILLVFADAPVVQIERLLLIL